MISNVFASLLLIPVFAISLSAVPQVDIDYEGEVDIYTGAPVEEETAVREGVEIVTLADGGVYDRVNHVFVYEAADTGMSVRSSVANGMMTTSPVSIETDDGLSVWLYKDGNAVDDMDLTNISAAGSYSIMLKSDDIQTQILTFTILRKKTGAVDYYTLPDGFFIRTVTLNGVTQTFSDIDTVDLTDEGEYDVIYRCRATDIDYELNIITDHTPPQITLTGVTDGVARGPVTIEGLAQNETITITRNGNPVTFLLDGVLRTTGEYRVVAMDDAGNTTVEEFKIKMYLNNQSIIFFLLLIGILAAAVGYMVWSNKRLRVR